jgi:hypothetical protein
VTLVLLAALLLQGGGWIVRPAAPTVGDTVRMERLVPAPPGAVGRARALTADELIEPLRPPEVLATRSGLVVRYTVAFFAPGRHEVAMPALEVVHPDGGVELVLGDTAVADVTAVVPDTAETPEARESRAPLGRVAPEPLPVVILGGGGLLLVVLWAVIRRRRGPLAGPAEPQSPAPDAPLLRWLAAGERRAVATLAMLRLRLRLEEAVPQANRGLALAECLEAVAAARSDWPVRELVDLMTALERARFAPLAGDDLTELVDRADVLLDRLAAAPAPGTAAGPAPLTA